MFIIQLYLIIKINHNHAKVSCTNKMNWFPVDDTIEVVTESIIYIYLTSFDNRNRIILYKLKQSNKINNKFYLMVPHKVSTTLITESKGTTYILNCQFYQFEGVYHYI